MTADYTCWDSDLRNTTQDRQRLKCADPKVVSKLAERDRQSRNSNLEMRKFWEDESLAHDAIVFVGFGCRWYTFDADAELVLERGLTTSEAFFVDCVVMPMASLAHDKDWLSALQADGYRVRFVSLKRGRGEVARVENLS